MLGGKKGLSDIVTNVLIILLVLVAVGIIWYFVQPFIREGVSGITTEAYTVSIGIQPRSVVVDSQNVSFQVSRAAGKGDLVAFIVVVTDNSGGSKAVRVNKSLGELETTGVVIDYVALGLSSVKQVAIVPIIADQTGREQNGQQSAPEFPANSTTTSNNNNNTGGVCTNGNTQGCNTINVLTYPGTQTCVGGAWGACSSAGFSCGDGVKSTPEACDTKGAKNFYGAACTDPLGLPGNKTCTSGTCQVNATCSCFMDFNYPSTGNNADGFIDWSDFSTWAYAFQQGDMQADCNHDGVLNATDGDPNDYQTDPATTCIGRLFDVNFNQGITVCNYYS